MTAMVRISLSGKAQLEAPCHADSLTDRAGK